MRGTINCNKCGAAFGTTSKNLCPKCNNVSCHIEIKWQGKKKPYRFYSDSEGDTFTFRKALAALIKINEQIRINEFDPNLWKLSNGQGLLLKKVALEWLEMRRTMVKNKELSINTHQKDTANMGQHILNPERGLADINMKDFGDNEYTVRRLTAFRDQLPRRMKCISRRDVMHTLHVFIVWSKNDRWYIRSIPKFPEVVGNDSKPKRALTSDQQDFALSNMPEAHRPIWEFLFETGIRMCEVCALKISDISFENKSIRIQRSAMPTLKDGHNERDKANHKAFIPLSDRAYEIIDKLTKQRFPDEWIFLYKSNRYGIRYLRYLWKRYSQLDITPYEATRHSFASQMSEKCTNVLALQSLMRHTDVRTTQKYFHARVEYLRDIVNTRKATVIDINKFSEEKAK